jgi:hypothetical protein
VTGPSKMSVRNVEVFYELLQDNVNSDTSDSIYVSDSEMKVKILSFGA